MVGLTESATSLGKTTLGPEWSSAKHQEQRRPTNHAPYLRGHPRFACQWDKSDALAELRLRQTSCDKHERSDVRAAFTKFIIVPSMRGSSVKNHLCESSYFTVAQS